MIWLHPEFGSSKLLLACCRDHGNYIADHSGAVSLPSPFAVNLDADDKDWVEPEHFRNCSS